MTKNLPISYPHQCPHRGGTSKNYCNLQGRTYSIHCQDYLDDFPRDCPLETQEVPQKQLGRSSRVKINLSFLIIFR
jgi:hypothetical protein